jgi:hypothetical protein
MSERFRSQYPPKVSGQGGLVVITLPLFVAEVPGHTQNFVVELPIEHAEELQAQLQPAITMALLQRRQG